MQLFGQTRYHQGHFGYSSRPLFPATLRLMLILLLRNTEPDYKNGAVVEVYRHITYSYSISRKYCTEVSRELRNSTASSDDHYTHIFDAAYLRRFSEILVCSWQRWLWPSTPFIWWPRFLIVQNPSMTWVLHYFTDKLILFLSYFGRFLTGHLSSIRPTLWDHIYLFMFYYK